MGLTIRWQPALSTAQKIDVPALPHGSLAIEIWAQQCKTINAAT